MDRSTLPIDVKALKPRYLARPATSRKQEFNLGVFAGCEASISDQFKSSTGRMVFGGALVGDGGRFRVEDEWEDYLRTSSLARAAGWRIYRLPLSALSQGTPTSLLSARA